MNYRDARIIIRQGSRVLDKNPEIEWYSGKETYTHPVRIKINGIWEDVFQYEKIIRENTQQQRETVFRCHIGDNRIIEVVISQGS
jgi:hypothetical protein